MAEEHFNGLSSAQAEALAILLEELGEAQQAIGKILRHGLHSRHPEGGPDNQSSLEHELGDVRAAAIIACSLDVVSEYEIGSFARAKLGAVQKYLHQEPVSGTWHASTASRPRSALKVCAHDGATPNDSVVANRRLDGGR